MKTMCPPGYHHNGFVVLQFNYSFTQQSLSLLKQQHTRKRTVPEVIKWVMRELSVRQPIPFSVALDQGYLSLSWNATPNLSSQLYTVYFGLSQPYYSYPELAEPGIKIIVPCGALGNALATALSRSKIDRSVCIKCTFCGKLLFEWPLKPFFALICLSRNSSTTDFCILILFPSFEKKVNYCNMQKEAQNQCQQDTGGSCLFIP